jgi:membrane-associated phospholipid phosphatase
VCTALLANRDATSNPTAPSQTPANPAFNDPANIPRWESWVRAYLLQWELCKGMTVDPSANGTSAMELKADGQTIVRLAQPSTAFFDAQLSRVLSWADLRVDRIPEILAQIDNQFAFVASVTGLNPDRHRNTVELLVNAIQFTVLIEMQFKHGLACWRAHQYSAQVQPVITTPGHGSFPSGHSTQAFMLARLLSFMLPAGAYFDSMREQLYRQAARIATNRVIAGVHFPIDSIAGRLLGHSIAEYIIARLTKGNAGQVVYREFDASVATANAGTDLDLDLVDPIDTLYTWGPFNAYQIHGPVGVNTAAAPSVLTELYDEGQAERAALAK